MTKKNKKQIVSDKLKKTFEKLEKNKKRSKF